MARPAFPVGKRTCRNIARRCGFLCALLRCTRGRRKIGSLVVVAARLECIRPTWGRTRRFVINRARWHFWISQTLMMTGSLTNVSGFTISMIASPYTSSFIADMSNPIVHPEFSRRIVGSLCFPLTVNIVPHSHPILIDIRALTQTEHHPALTRRNDPSRSEEPVPCHQDGIQHGFVQQGVTHPFGDDHVHLSYPVGKRDVFDLATNYPRRNLNPPSVVLFLQREGGRSRFL